MYDLIISGGLVIDGTGFPRYKADIGVIDGKIARIARAIPANAKRRIDAQERIVCPGFIDTHTHYDAQVFWDPLLTPSCWHGNTTIVMGFCGNSLAPCREDQRHALMETLARVEDIPADAMNAGIVWGWESFPEFLDAIDRQRPGMNVAVMVGHSTIRYYVMGEDAFDRDPTPAEISRMKELIREAIDAGACGFSSSTTPSQVASNGKPIPSVNAKDWEFIELVEPLGELGKGVFQIAPNGLALTQENAPLYTELARRTGQPVIGGAVLQMWNVPHLWENSLKLARQAISQGARLYPQSLSQIVSFKLSLKTTNLFDDMLAWRRVMTKGFEQKRSALRDPATREELREEIENGTNVVLFPRKRWDLVIVREPKLPRNERFRGSSVAHIAGQLGCAPFDAFMDLSLDEDLETVFEIVGAINGDKAAVAAFVRDPITLLGLTDAGAHVTRECRPGLGTDLIQTWVREEGALTLEEAIVKLTSHPAHVFGFNDRGLVKTGYAADLVVFDPEKIGALEEEMVHDLPGGHPRLIQKSTGIDYTIVNGEVFMEGLSCTGRYAGKVLR